MHADVNTRSGIRHLRVFLACNERRGPRNLGAPTVLIFKANKSQCVTACFCSRMPELVSSFFYIVVFVPACVAISALCFGDNSAITSLCAAIAFSLDYAIVPPWFPMLAVSSFSGRTCQWCRLRGRYGELRGRHCRLRILSVFSLPLFARPSGSLACVRRPSCRRSEHGPGRQIF